MDINKGVSRRRFCAAALAGTATAVAGCGTVRSDDRFFARHDLPIGLQLYTVGTAARADFPGTLKKVAQAGYRTVELAGFHGQGVAGLKQAADAAGIRYGGIHVQPKAQGTEPGFDQDPGKLAADLHSLGISEVVLPSPIGRNDWPATATFLNNTAAALQKEGLRLSYHNHNVEFAPVDGGPRGIDLLLARTDPALVSFEMDIGWVAAAGADPLPLLRATPHRFRMVHVKDLLASTTPNFAYHMDSTEVGAGMLDWKQLLSTAYATGVRGFFVEQEPPFSKDPFQSIAESCAYLAALRA